ncbi:MAG: o-succinylbenzoate synthase [Crocinitomicaceae bacterium]|nr:o-succinylbenzoate synthase [Crocinitomicaceae bacterium]
MRALPRITKVDVYPWNLEFKRPAKTSRNILHNKPSWFIKLSDEQGHEGWGECSIIPGLSMDRAIEIETYLARVSANPPQRAEDIPASLPAVQFAFEMAMNGLRNENDLQFFPGNFAEGVSTIAINGLIWMADAEDMLEQARYLLRNGFTTLKMKVGSMPFDAELEWLSALRNEAGADVVLRTDANGAFSKIEPGWTTLRKLEVLADLNFHSIEQPLNSSDVEGLADLSANSPLPIALDESLIGVRGVQQKAALLDTIRPQFVVLKPSLLGGFAECQEWVDLAEDRELGWWATSALESNLGLYAIAQWAKDGVKTRQPILVQGLGTGGLFTNNIPGSLFAEAGKLINRVGHHWPNLTSFLINL